MYKVTENEQKMKKCPLWNKIKCTEIEWEISHAIGV